MRASVHRDLRNAGAAGTRHAGFHEVVREDLGVAEVFWRRGRLPMQGLANLAAAMVNRANSQKPTDI
jgi:hypothetical protein